jgi:hypothetical protein
MNAAMTREGLECRWVDAFQVALAVERFVGVGALNAIDFKADFDFLAFAVFALLIRVSQIVDSLKIWMCFGHVCKIYDSRFSAKGGEPCCFQLCFSGLKVFNFGAVELSGNVSRFFASIFDKENNWCAIIANLCFNKFSSQKVARNFRFPVIARRIIYFMLRGFGDGFKNLLRGEKVWGFGAAFDGSEFSAINNPTNDSDGRRNRKGYGYIDQRVIHIISRHGGETLTGLMRYGKWIGAKGN